MNEKPILSVYHEKRRILQSGPHTGKAHIKIQVTFIVTDGVNKQWIRRHYKTGIYCTVKDFPKIIDWSNGRYNTEVLDLRAQLRPIITKAELILEKVHTQRQFESHFLSNFQVDALAPYFKEKIDELRNAKPRPKISSAEKYNTALVSLQDYFGEGVTFGMLTPETLQEYEDDYVSQNRDKDGKKGKKSLTSVGINLRCARHIYKRVIKRGIVPEKLYPFGVGGYVIPEGGDDTKKFLDSKEKAAFLNHEFEDPRLAELHDYAKFSFFAFGINLSDVARLRKTMVFKDYISIDRQKTKGRKKKTKKHNIPLHREMKAIIKRRGKKTLIPDDYVFPILDYNMNEEAIFYKIRALVDDVNDMLALIAKEYKFETKLTSYTLRHTFSFNVMEMGGTTEQLQDMLAHGSVKTTESYKHGFALEIKKKFSDGLG